VDFLTGEGLTSVPLANLLKEFHPGDFVQVMGGPFQGQAGWVVGGWDNIVVIASETSTDDATAEIRDVKVGLISQPSCTSANTNICFQHLEVHVNCLKATTAPFLHAPPSSGLVKQLLNDLIPWIGTSILVVKPGHAMKGYRGIVKTVLRKQRSASGLRVVAQLTHLNSSCPFQSMVLDYDEVVEAKCVDLRYLLMCFLLNMRTLQIQM
jgi:hypothetical protein